MSNVHITRAYDTIANARTAADEHQSFIITDESNRLSSTDGNVATGNIYLYAIGKIVNQNTGAETYSDEEFNSIICDADMVIGVSGTAYNTISSYGATESYIQFANSSTGLAAATDGIIVGIDGSDNLIIENQEYNGELYLRHDEGVINFYDTSVSRSHLVANDNSTSILSDGTEILSVYSTGVFVNNGGLRVSSAATYTDPGNGNIYVEGNGTIVGTLAVNGNATLGNSSGDSHTVNGTLTINPGSQDYEFGNSAGALYLQRKDAGSSDLYIVTQTENGSQSCAFQVWGVGGKTQTTNRERLVLIGSSNGTNISAFQIYTDSNGTGTSDRKLRLYAGTSNAGQLDLETNGNITSTHSNTNGGITVTRSGNASITLNAGASANGAGLLTNLDLIYLNTTNDPTDPMLLVDTTGNVFIYYDLDVDGTTYLDNTNIAGILNINPGTTDYEIGNHDTTSIYLQNKDTGKSSRLTLFTNDGLGTDDAAFIAFGLGTPNSTTNSEYGYWGYNAGDSSYDLYAHASGSGSILPVHIYSDTANAGIQLNILNNGTVEIGQDLDFTNGKGASTTSGMIYGSVYYSDDTNTLTRTFASPNVFYDLENDGTYQPTVGETNGVTGTASTGELLLPKGIYRIDGSCSFTYSSATPGTVDIRILVGGVDVGLRGDVYLASNDKHNVSLGSMTVRCAASTVIKMQAASSNASPDLEVSHMQFSALKIGDYTS